MTSILRRHQRPRCDVREGPRFREGAEIPGFYRPTKKWDVVESVSGRSTRRASPMAGLSLFSRRRTWIYEARWAREGGVRILCQRMVLERNYNAATFLLAPRSTEGAFREPSADLRIETFLKSLFGHLIGCL